MDIHLDTINPKLLELRAVKEILAELYDIQISEENDLIQQRIVDSRLMGMKSDLCTTTWRSYFS